MKKLLVLALALVLTACTAVPAAAPTPLPQPTAVPPTPAPPEVVVVTVVVPATPMPQPTMEPPAPAPEVIVVTATPETAPAAPAASGGPIAIPDDLGNVFKNITISGDAIKLRCEPKTITFTATAIDPYIVAVHFYYRMEDRQGTYITEWKNRGEMKSDGSGNFTLKFDVLDIHPDLRYYEKAWFDFEFVGLNKQGDVVGRSQKINQMITYYKECQ